MQISKMSEMAEGGGGCAGEGGVQTPEYQTASELFDLMTKNTQFDKTNEYSLSTQDLVLLYENIDIGTRLIKDASKVTIRKPNQYVETIVYNDDHESSSDCSEICNPNDLQDFMLNQEKLDFLKDKSLENLLCPKLGGIEMHISNLSSDYAKSFLFQDPYIKNKLENLNVLGSSSKFDNLFSTSLIDYICCKRLEDNYNFYMENIIRYVQHTIEQLKRISNGDYLTDRTKEKWMEVNCNIEQDDNTKVLATSASIPLHVECKAAGNALWDDIVHSEVDIRSLSKILEKKIIVEIPKLICGSYQLFSKRCADNLVISCHKKQQSAEHKGQESRVDVVLQLQRSQTGQVISNISSIMILKTTPALPDIRAKAILPLPYKEQIDEQIIQNIKKDSKEPSITVIELIRDPQPIVAENGVKNAIAEKILEEDNDVYQDSQNGDSYAGTNDYPFSDRIASYASIQYSSESSLAVKDTFSINNVEEKPYNLITPDELHMTMRRLNMQNSVLNECGEDTISQCTSKRRSPVRVRIKSPYENKSLLMEEKKRKRLLEIREKREKKKMALSENCKISKHKYTKGAVLPQASSSVTKLSITNKSFYNSIYGQNGNSENKSKTRKPLKSTPEVSITIDEIQEDYFEPPMLSPNMDSKKYINRSYYLDDAETEMMYMQMTIDEMDEVKNIVNSCSASDSNVSNEFNASLEILQGQMTPSDTNLTGEPTFLADAKEAFPEVTRIKEILPIAENTIASTTMQNTSKKNSSTDECRKSIDQLYELMNKFGKPNVPTDLKNNLSTSVNFDDRNTIQDSERGPKHAKHINVCNDDSTGISNMTTTKLKSNKAQTGGVPKVTISSKLHSPKVETDKMKKERNKSMVVSPPFKGPFPDNPLKAISQLLHEFDSVKKNRQKLPIEAKACKKVENIPSDVKTYSRQGSSRRKSRMDQHFTDEGKKANLYNMNPKDKKVKPMTPSELVRTPHKQITAEDKYIDKIQPKKVTDIIDEAREARGEAVRGPSKNYSRLNSLAQPKKSYLNAHHEAYQSKHGNKVSVERQKLATTSAPATLVERIMMSPTSSNRNRSRKNGSESFSNTTASVKQRAPSVPQIDQQKAAMCTRKLKSASSSPESVTRLSGHKYSCPLNASDLMADISRSCKMGAVESYLHSHYRAASPVREELAAGLRGRVPLDPQDLASITVSVSAGDSSEQGAPPRKPSPLPGLPSLLAPLAECAESIASNDKPRSESDYSANFLEDCHVTTAVDSFYSESLTSAGHLVSSTTEMEQLETALCSHLTGACQKRLRIKNLTLTPKPSSQRVFLLQSGDAASVLVKSITNLKLKKNAEDLSELTAMPVLSNSHLDWTFVQLPAQIATVGYAFPEHRLHRAGSRSMLTELPASVASINTAQSFCQSNHNLRESFGDTSAVDVRRQFTAVLGTGSNCMFINQDTNSQMLKIEASEFNNERHVSSLNDVESASENTKVVEGTDDSAKEKMAVDVENDYVSKPAHASTSAPSPVSEEISYTTSLDVLVGLLNEIQKITCQNQIVTTDRQNYTDFDISNECVAVKKVENTTCDLISLSSLQNLRRLESHHSIFSCYLSNEGSVESIEPVLELKRNSRFTENSVDMQAVASRGVITEHAAVGGSKPAVVDKEVNTNLCEGNADRCTNVPSDVSCSLVHFGAYATASALSVSDPSSHSTLSMEYHTSHSSATKTPLCKKIIEPQVGTRERRANISRDKIGLNEKCFTTLSIRNIEDVKNESLIARRELRYCVKNIDLDPMFKIKRDLLVSMYSILVLTVFAALSFPELLMFQS